MNYFIHEINKIVDEKGIYYNFIINIKFKILLLTLKLKINIDFRICFIFY